MKQDKTNLLALAAAVAGHTFWGFSFFASRTALDTAHMFLLLSHRFLLAFLVMNLLLVFGLARLQLAGKRLRLLFALGLMEPVVYFFGEQVGILHSNTIFSGVMIAMIPIVCTLAAVPALGEQPTGGQLLFSTCTVNHAENEDNVGYIAAKGFECALSKQLLPGENGADGFFYARMIRK